MNRMYGFLLLVGVAATGAWPQTAGDGPAKPPTAVFTTSNTTRTIEHWTAVGRYSAEATDNYWAAFVAIPQGPEWRAAWKQLDALGARLVSYDGDGAWGLVYRLRLSGNDEKVYQVLTGYSRFINMAPVRTKEKLSSAIWTRQVPASSFVDTTQGLLRAMVEFYEDQTPKQVTAALSGFVEEILHQLRPHERIVQVIATAGALERLAASDDVKWICETAPAPPTNDLSRKIMLVDSLQKMAGFDTSRTPPHFPPDSTWNYNVPYTGDSVWIGISEAVDSMHPDFREKRFLPNGDTSSYLRWADRTGTPTWAAGGAHGTLVASNAAGNGWRSHLDSTRGATYQWRGVAPKALLMAQDDDNLGLGDVNNHSHGHFPCDDYYAGGEESADREVCNHDTASAAHTNNVLVHAAGNAGSAKDYGYTKGHFSMEACPKDGIKVGSCDKLSGHHSAFSSVGPTMDGRIGPDVMAPGGGADFSEKWMIDIDYVQWKSNTNQLKKAWNFTSLSPDTQGQWYMDSLRLGPGDTLARLWGPAATHRSGGFLLAAMSPAQSGAVGDSLIIRMRITDSLSQPIIPRGLARSIPVLVYWNVLAQDYTNVEFYAPMNAGWQTLRVPLAKAHQMVERAPQFSAVWPPAGTVQTFALGFQSQWVLGAQCQQLQYGWYEYGDGRGTSMACPMVTGLVALMLEKYGDSVLHNIHLIHNRPFWNSTAKAILIETARDMVDTSMTAIDESNPDYVAAGYPVRTVYGVGPDWATGYGLVDAVKAVAYVDTNHFLEDTARYSELRQYHMRIPPGTTRAAVTLAWDDPPAPIPNDSTTAHVRKLVNDLDLYLLPPSGGTAWRTWALDNTKLWGSTDGTGIDSGFWAGAWHHSIHPDSVIKQNPARRWLDTLNNVEMVSVNNPDTGQWLVVVDGRAVRAYQSMGGSSSDFRQDYSLATDFHLTRDTLGPDDMGPLYGYNGSTCDRQTRNGNLQLKGHTATGTLSGLIFGNAASMKSNGDLVCASLLTNQAFWLDVAGNLTGGLILRGPDGKVTMHIATDGTVRVRANAYQGFGAF